jgi:hypothetical protein
MEMKKSGWFKILAFACATAMVVACNDDSSEPMGKGTAEFEVTDAPSDDASLKADIKVDGKSVSGFTKQTIDLKAYQEGNTKLLATAQDLDAKSYSKLTLVLDLENDADGNSPGCYALTKENVKYNLKTTTNGMAEVVINKSWKVAANTTSKIVMDFDLRKSLAYSDDPEVRYTFVNDENLSAAIRLVARESTGTINGEYEAESSDADKIIVYAYKKGTFNETTETTPQGDNHLLFAHAVASSEVKESLSGRTFKLAFLEAGEYELYFAAHDPDTNGRMVFTSMLHSDTSINGSAANIITVQAGATINVAGTISIL